MVMLRAALIAVLLVAGLPAKAADIVGASYDAARDEIVVDIVYRGTRPGHEFTVQWGPCEEAGGLPAGVVGRLIDRQGNDIAREEFRVSARIGLRDMPCRPAEVMLRLGRFAQARVLVPARAE
jgi:hypothetical protein